MLDSSVADRCQLVINSARVLYSIHQRGKWLLELRQARVVNDKVINAVS